MNSFRLGYILLVAFVLSCGRSGQITYGQLGLQYCNSDQECTEREICNAKSYCELRALPCKAKQDCPDPMQCSGGLCLEPGLCYFNYQCSKGFSCQNYQCLPFRCQKDSECLSGQICEVAYGSCRETPCLSSSSCGSEFCCHPLTSYCVASSICERFEKGIPLDCKPETEKCDRVDNDCDGAIDEDFSQLGQSCEVGLGVCKRIGHWVCSQDQSTVTCDVQPGNPDREVCDGIDNNCNGVIDEGCL